MTDAKIFRYNRVVNIGVSPFGVCDIRHIYMFWQLKDGIF